GSVAASPEEARRIARDLGGAVAVKAQVLVGGRGKAGGVRLAGTPEEAGEAAAAVLKMQIGGYPVHKLLVEEAVDIRQELYLGVAIDRNLRQAVLMASAAGGVEIEQVARDDPKMIKRVAVDPLMELDTAQTQGLAKGIGLPEELYSTFNSVAHDLYEAFLSYDALLAEINPLAVTDTGQLLALDGKVILDDNALFRHPDLEQLRDASDETLAEREAREAGLSYVYLGGEIGCMVNGAGLAMATMDVIKFFGGAPANFLDVGGGARAERVAAALRLVMSAPKIKVVLINIFGGITRCDEVARGIVAALEGIESRVPLVVQLSGTNEGQGRKILNASTYRLTVAGTLTEAAQKAVALAGGRLEA
ncbi:MAG: ADP-forming succinate--CoA ligase subunit beta, partial [Anaerolineae bacterium]